MDSRVRIKILICHRRSKEKLLEHPDIPKVIEKVVSAALDDEHKNQAVAQKILIERILPIITFEKQFDNRGKITINVSVIGKNSETLEGEVIERLKLRDFNGQWRA